MRWAVVLAVGCGGGITDRDQLAEALAGAEPGDVIELGDARIEGAFDVPSGVRIQGEGRDRSVLIVPAGERGLRITEGDAASSIADLTIESSGIAGIAVVGVVGPCDFDEDPIPETGGISIERVTVIASAGIGIGLRDVAHATVSHVEIRGPVTPASDVASPPDPEVTAVYGLVLNHVADAAISDLTVTGFASAGVLSDRSRARWQRGRAGANRTVGLYVSSGRFELDAVELDSSFRGDAGAAYGAIFTSSASATSSALSVHDNESAGLLHNAATGVHTGLDARANDFGAVYAQLGADVEVSGSMADNLLGGLIAYRARRITIRDASIDRSVLVTRFHPPDPTFDLGDGIQLVEPSGDVTIENVTLDANGRAGILFDLGGGSLDPSNFRNVAVSGTGSQLGAIVQGGTPPPGWDAAITRSADVAANDALFTGGLGVVGPCDFPTP